MAATHALSEWCSTFHRGTRRASLSVVLGCLLSFSFAAPAQSAEGDAAVQANAEVDGEPIDICRLTRTFTEDFDTLDVSPWDAVKARWIAHTPWAGDFGDARFNDPRKGFPFTIKDGVLRIEAKKDKRGKWHSGLLASNDGWGYGFSQIYGYFEARMKLPAGPGVWPAFWLASSSHRKDKTENIEIDIIEYYGHNDDAYQTAFHIWKRDGSGDHSGALESQPVPAGSLTTQFHTYGAYVGPEEIVYYFNRKPIWSVKTPPEMVKPLFPLVNLALGSGWPIDKTPDPSFLYVDYIHVYAHQFGEPRKDC